MRLILTCLALLTAFVAPARADDPADYQTEVTAVENYLNTLGTGRARFMQTTHDGTQLVGTFYLNRPGKLRFEYDAPIDDFVVADGLFLYFYDSQLKEQTNIPIGQTLADFFLRKSIKFGDDILVADVKRGGDLLQIKLVQKDDPDGGSLTLGLRENPLSLKKWRITDPQDLVTEVELFYLKTGMELDRKLFTYIDPDHGKTSKINE